MLKSQATIAENTKNFKPTRSFNCFGCSQDNHAGLKLKFEVSDENVVFSSVQLCHIYESFPGVIHGGIVATLLDEVMAQAAYIFRNQPSMTVGLRIRYLQPMRTNHSYLASAKIVSELSPTAVEVEGSLNDPEGDQAVAVATGTFFSLSQDALFSGKSYLPDVTLNALSSFSRKPSVDR